MRVKRFFYLVEELVHHGLFKTLAEFLLGALADGNQFVGNYFKHTMGMVGPILSETCCKFVGVTSQDDTVADWVVDLVLHVDILMNI